MITAYAVVFQGAVALKLDRAAADAYAVRFSGSTVHKLVEEAAILRKFDAYVPADVVSSMRWRIAELEAQVAAQRDALQLAHARMVDAPNGIGGVNG